MLLKIATLALVPVLIVQGKQVKKNTISLPEPTGDRSGQIGHGKKLSILIVGDSAAAGVGVDHQADALSGALLAQLQEDFQIDWALYAKTGNTTSQVIRTLHQVESKHYDVVVTSVGVNDVTKLMSAQHWIQKQQQLYDLIQNKFSPALILASGVPPMQLFPALPNPLAWLFGQYAAKMNQQLATLVAERNNMQCIEYDVEQYAKLNLNMAADGFHPSKEIYQFWSIQIAERIRQKF